MDPFPSLSGSDLRPLPPYMGCSGYSSISVGVLIRIPISLSLSLSLSLSMCIPFNFTTSSLLSLL